MKSLERVCSPIPILALPAQQQQLLMEFLFSFSLRLQRGMFNKFSLSPENKKKKSRKTFRQHQTRKRKVSVL